MDPLDALKVLERQKVDLLLSDIRMPIMDGFEMISQAKQYQPDLPVLVMTGLTEQAKVKGLASLDAPVGTLVASSTAPNGVALDGTSGDHSVYARHLLATLPTPGLAQSISILNGVAFVAESETIVSEFDVGVTGRFFRIREVP